MMTDTLDPAVYQSALDNLRTLGHTKSQFQDPATNSVCAFGALRMALFGKVYEIHATTEDDDGNMVATEESKRLKNYSVHLMLVGNAEGIPNLVAWNDLEETTQEDVEKIFIKAIETCNLPVE